MFDVSLSELMVIGVVALVVIGPERLPRVARTAGHLLGRLQRYVSMVKADINREMQLEELKKLQQEVTEQVKSVESTIHHEIRDVESSVNQSIAPLQELSAVPSSLTFGDDPAAGPVADGASGTLAGAALPPAESAQPPSDKP